MSRVVVIGGGFGGLASAARLAKLGHDVTLVEASDRLGGAIGYVESAYAEQNKLTTTMLQNQAGKFVAPTMDTFQAAAKNADWSKVQNFAIDLNDQPGADSWPIVSATFVLVPTDPKDEKRSAAVLTFFDWGFTHGDDIAKQLLYVPLPAKVHDAVRVEWKKSVPGAK